MAGENDKVTADSSQMESADPFSKMSIAEQVDEKAVVQTEGPPPQPPPAMDGGTRAWLQVVGSFLVFGNLWGLPFAYGTFQNYYELTYLTDETSSNIAWVGTVTMFLLILTGVISGPLFDLGYFKTMLFAGAAMETFGMFMLSLSTKYWQVFLTQGIVMGLGNGLLYLPGLALVGRSFKKRRAVAMGIVSCGAPVGGIIYTLVFQQLIDTLDFDWTVRVMSFMMLGSYIIAFPLLLWGAHNVGDIGTGQARKLFDKSALRDGPFWSYSIGNTFIFMGYMIPFFVSSSPQSSPQPPPQPQSTTLTRTVHPHLRPTRTRHGPLLGPLHRHLRPSLLHRRPPDRLPRRLPRRRHDPLDNLRFDVCRLQPRLDGDPQPWRLHRVQLHVRCVLGRTHPVTA